MDPIRIPIDGILDLHTFRPETVSDLLEDYITECLRLGIFSVRIIHGKGTGALKRRVRAVLERNRFVASIRDAPPEAGGWGATLVELKP
jgi:dsDNA-specific endonuclease/ATPase MutS2